MRLSQQLHRTPQCGSAHLIALVVTGLLAAIWYRHQQTQVIVTPAQDLGYSTPPSMLMPKHEPSGFARFSPAINWPAIRAGSVALAFDQVFTATQAVVPAVLVIEEKEALTGPAVHPAIAAIVISPVWPSIATEATASAESAVLENTARLAVGPSPPMSPIAVSESKPEASAFVAAVRETPAQRIGTTTTEHVASAPSMLPVFKLDSFLTPAADRIIYRDKTKVDALSHDATAVFVIEAGTKLILNGCNFPGGVIIKVTELENAEEWKITRVELKGGTKIGGGLDGVAINLGLVAPDCDLEYSYAGSAFAAQIDIEGFTAVNKLRRTHQIQLKGVVLVKDQERQVWESAIEADAEVFENLPAGIVYLLPDTAWDLLKVD